MSDKASHTPGPWQCDSHIKPISGERVVMAPGFDPIAIVHAGSDRSPFDARLIAAAPDLLAACEYVADMLSQSFPDGRGGTETMADKLGAVGGYHAAELIRVAVSKAKGNP